MTLRVRPEIPSLRSVRLVRAFERSLGCACERGDFRVVHYSLQSNHAHLIVEAASPRALACGMKAVASRLARAVNRVLGRKGAVLADRYHLRRLATPREVRHAIAYVLLNARKHLAERIGGFVGSVAALDPASSARWFEGWRPGEGGGAACARPTDAAPAVSRARSWLLRVGWRRHGLLDPLEIPGRPRPGSTRIASP